MNKDVFLILTSRPLPLLVFIIFVWHIINREDSVSIKMQKNYHTYVKGTKKTNSNFLQLLFLPSLYSKFPTLLLNCGNVSLTNGKDGSSTMCQWRTLNLLYDKASWQAQRKMFIFTSLQVTIIFYSGTSTHKTNCKLTVHLANLKKFPFWESIVLIKKLLLTTTKLVWLGLLSVCTNWTVYVTLL